ncbi:hypothetical protein QBC34DRAFT_430527 [Podospora aff. communis PSN243]|uniref:Uncharacterized protein n=1 Tax=Podospora aff. communis PSN243 TaxID=3040156 RepID=A0AAV9G8E3_9PEZI|nr:hypothetical protein QBC34DRAFT_430527 [Podospora aff. communis PSN243]
MADTYHKLLGAIQVALHGGISPEKINTDVAKGKQTIFQPHQNAKLANIFPFNLKPGSKAATPRTPTHGAKNKTFDYMGFVYEPFSSGSGISERNGEDDAKIVDPNSNTIVKSAHVHNTSLQNSMDADRDDLPPRLRRLCHALSQLKAGETHKLRPILRNIQLVKLKEEWKGIQYDLRNNRGDAEAIANAMDIPTARGRTDLSRTKEHLCGCVGITKEEFSSYMQAAAIPFACCSVLSQIRAADPDNHICNTAQELPDCVVSTMWDEQPFSWDTSRVRHIAAEGSVFDAMQVLRRFNQTKRASLGCGEERRCGMLAI